MTYKQYQFLKGLHKLSPKMNDEQKFPSHFIDDIEKKTELSKEEVLTIAKELSQLGYVQLGQNDDAAKERSGYIHVVRITYSGVVAKNDYIHNKFLSMLKNIIIPAIVSILCSFIVNCFEQ